MKKRFTILIATLMLLTMTSQPTRLWGQTATQTSFTATSGNVNSNSIVSYTAYKGSAITSPGVYDNAIRLYQASSSSNTGGYVVIGVSNGYKITSATIQSTMATTTGYKLTDTDPGNTTPAKNTFNVSNYSLSINTDYEVSNIETQYIVFACFGTSKSTRLYLSKISITYQSTGGGTQTVTITGDGISNNAISFAYNNTSNHTGTIACNNFDGTPTPSIGVYTNSTCTAAYIGSDFLAVPSKSTTDFTYRFTNANPSTSSPRTFYMRATAGGVNSNVVAVSQAASPTLYSVTFNPDGGTFEPNAVFTSDQVSLEAGDYTLPSATKDGCLFVSWKDGNDNEEYYAGASYTLSGNVTLTAQWEALDYNNTYTSGVGLLSISGGTSASTCKVKIYNVEYDGIKAGTSSVAGAWLVTVPANTTKLHLHLAGWNGESVTLSVTSTGYSSGISLTANSGISGSGSTYTFSGDPSTDSYYKIITFADPLEEAVTLTFTASSGKRFVVWGVNAEKSKDPYITAADVDIDDDETAGSITYTVHNIPDPAGTLTASTTSDWLTLGDIEENVPFTCKANPNAVERTATVTLTYTYGGSETTTLDVKVTQAPLVVDYTYTLATSIENGKHYIITNGSTKIMGSQSSNNRTAVDAPSNSYNSTNNEFSIPSNASICEFVINGPDADGYYTIHDANANTGYLYANGNNKNNYLKTQDFNSDYGRWSIAINTTIGDDYGKATIIGQGDNTNKYMRYNSDGWFSCYSSSSSVTALPYLYVRNDSYYEFYVDIAKYTTPEVGEPVNGWNFIASPLASAYTLSESDLVAGTYDLYRLNNTTWENYKNDAHDDFTTLANGQGYLYANSANTTLHFSGAINAFTTAGDANQKVYSEGWNLIGNPYNIPVYINKPYYTLNAARNAVVATAVKNVAIAPCTGVIADGGTIIFTEASQNVQAINNGNIQMVLAHNVNVRGDKRVETIDNAIVSFNEGSQLEKFYFGNPSASIFIPQNGEDYAIAFSNRQGDVPLNFKAKELGTYTISFEGEEMDLNGIYLIDMLDEEDIDLSVNPSYTFIGSPVDQAERFKIVFRGVGNSGNDVFAYQNGNDIIVSGEGELQIFDVTGRSVMTTTISGVKTINVPTMGVYIFRLNEKVQKIVVR